jgi:hypothetical protein
MGADVTRFARVDFHSDERVFGIKDEDRLLHVYVIAKTGTGKSTNEIRRVFRAHTE